MTKGVGECRIEPWAGGQRMEVKKGTSENSQGRGNTVLVFCSAVFHPRI